jgi:hypothetical protein
MIAERRESYGFLLPRVEEKMHVGLETKFKRSKKWNFSLYRNYMSWGGSVTPIL